MVEATPAPFACAPRSEKPFAVFKRATGMVMLAKSADDDGKGMDAGHGSQCRPCYGVLGPRQTRLCALRLQGMDNAVFVRRVIAGRSEPHHSQAVLKGVVVERLRNLGCRCCCILARGQARPW